MESPEGARGLHDKQWWNAVLTTSSPAIIQRLYVYSYGLGGNVHISG
jgi:hypothetical protein